MNARASFSSAGAGGVIVSHLRGKARVLPRSWTAADDARLLREGRTAAGRAHLSDELRISERTLLCRFLFIGGRV